LLPASWPTAAIVTTPSSSMLTFAPDCSSMSRIVAPLGPMILPISFGLTWIVMIRGAHGDISVRSFASVLFIAARMLEPALLGLVQSLRHDVEREALHLDVHLNGRDTLFGTRDLEVHVAEAVLGARMSVRIAILSPSLISPIATPAHAALIGTPASISDSELPQTVAIEEEPLDSSTSETIRMV